MSIWVLKRQLHHFTLRQFPHRNTVRTCIHTTREYKQMGYDCVVIFFFVVVLTGSGGLVDTVKQRKFIVEILCDKYIKQLYLHYKRAGTRLIAFADRELTKTKLTHEEHVHKILYILYTRVMINLRQPNFV